MRLVNCLCALLLLSGNALGESVGVYKSGLEGVSFFYSDGSFGDESYQSVGAWRMDYLSIKYCPPSSRWKCMVGALSFAVPKNPSVGEWCFGGGRFVRKYYSPKKEKGFIVATYDYPERVNKRVFTFKFDTILGIEKVWDGEVAVHTLISRTGLLSEEFVGESLLTVKELNFLLGICSLPLESGKIEEEIFGREIIVDYKE